MRLLWALRWNLAGLAATLALYWVMWPLTVHHEARFDLAILLVVVVIKCARAQTREAQTRDRRKQ